MVFAEIQRDLTLQDLREYLEFQYPELPLDSEPMYLDDAPMFDYMVPVAGPIFREILEKALEE